MSNNVVRVWWGEEEEEEEEYRCVAELEFGFGGCDGDRTLWGDAVV